MEVGGCWAVSSLGGIGHSGDSGWTQWQLEVISGLAE